MLAELSRRAVVVAQDGGGGSAQSIFDQLRPWLPDQWNPAVQKVLGIVAAGALVVSGIALLVGAGQTALGRGMSNVHWARQGRSNLVSAIVGIALIAAAPALALFIWNVAGETAAGAGG